MRAVAVLTPRHLALRAVIASAEKCRCVRTLTLTLRSCELVASLRSTGGDRMTSASGWHSRQTAATVSLRGVFRRANTRWLYGALREVSRGRRATAVRLDSRLPTPDWTPDSRLDSRLATPD